MKKLNAGALQLVTYITVIIALLLGCFILLVHTQRKFKTKSYNLTETIQNIDKGILDFVNSAPKQDSVSIYTNKGALNYKLEPWGVFQKLGIISKQKTYTYKKTALLGSSQPIEENALFIKDHNKALVLVGDTTIKGDAYLPEQGIKSGNIAGQTYSKPRFVDGNIAPIKQFPKLKFKLRNYLQNIQNYYDNTNSEPIYIKSGGTYLNSFERSTQVYINPNPIYLENITLKGNIIIQSDAKIVIDASSNLKDVILIAPIIEIEDTTKGTFQAFASEYITVGKHCNLKYPSALVLVKDYRNSFTEDNYIDVGSNSRLRGSIVLLGRKDSKNYNPQLIINKSVEIKGEIYSEQTIELLGKVFGTIYTDGFITRANGSYYQNHLCDVEINRHKLEDEYVGLAFQNSKKGIAKWLY
ncbi:hypothetical protein [Winogradskyella haliclonae]|uniref:Polymer-forming cytoskeletal protein n=1 Tax=Winogradskyella haliclonae TaxID=2048558 RepID=A0ABQ2BZ25_9FLAO|nr:hypothetical protein [Winogradskyella haliclonae]GGI57737.1 hypothetical protein GCM10011444_20460 [Winogradskyella haliclonae]